MEKFMSNILEPEDTPKSAKELVDKGWVEFIGYGATNIPIYRVVRSFKRPMWYAEGQSGADTMTYDVGDEIIL